MYKKFSIPSFRHVRTVNIVGLRVTPQVIVIARTVTTPTQPEPYHIKRKNLGL
ncbi:MAG: hypothetical protein OXE92_11200 [Bacteroidetes bacterium]|nr:hypothetical protein [Bacteroidota bacterium]